jgi:hypothetical protein
VDYNEEYMKFFKALIDETRASSIYTDAMGYIDEQFNNYSISDKEKAELTINFVTNMTNSIITSAMQVALSGVKIAKEIESVDNTNSMQSANKELLEAEKEYKVRQKEMLSITNEDNRIIKALDSTSDMIGTIGAGGLEIPQKLIENYFGLLNQLLGTSYDGQITIDKKAG